MIPSNIPNANKYITSKELTVEAQDLPHVQFFSVFFNNRPHIKTSAQSFVESERYPIPLPEDLVFESGQHYHICVENTEPDCIPTMQFFLYTK